MSTLQNHKKTHTSWITILVIVMILSFPRSFSIYRAIFIGLLISISWLIDYRPIRETKLRFAILLFYGCTSSLGIAWTIIGSFNGASAFAVSDYLRLYVLWSFFYIMLLHWILLNGDFIAIHMAVVASSILIPSINLVGMADSYYQLDIFSSFIRDELEMKIVFYDGGYTSFASHNIGSLFFIIPYLITYSIIKKTNNKKDYLLTIGLLLSFAFALASGRRALWIVIAAQPIIIFLLASLSNISIDYRSILKRFIKLLCTAIVISIYNLDWITSIDLDSISEYAKMIFLTNDERIVQSPFLIDGFLKHPIWGSGYGINAGYTRNSERPWIYELTYHQLLFNMGIIGTLSLVSLLTVYIRSSIMKIKKYTSIGHYGCSIMVGIASFALGAYSNPYFGSFDFLLIVALVPLITAYKESEVSFELEA